MISDTPRYDSLITELSARIDDVLTPLLVPDQPCALLDFPSYANVGDSAIWLGEIEYLRRRRMRVVYACDVATYSPDTLSARLGDGTIFLSGGGNFGDLWPRHQHFRETVVRDFPNNRIIQLPQSIHFREQRSVETARRVFNAHKDVTLLCRDEKSLEFARARFDRPSMLCPDMAFALGTLERPQEPATDIVWLSRTDEESVGFRLPATGIGVERTDWLADVPTALFERNHTFSERVVRGGEDPGADLNHLLETFEPLARERLLRGCRMLSRGSVVITDRLHGHILCLLLGIPHVVLDNSYGKVRGFYEAWTRSSPLAHWAASPEEALDLARLIADTSPSAVSRTTPQGTEDVGARRLREAVQEIQALVPPGKSFILVEQDEWKDPLGASTCVVPFLERDGNYWGPPPDSETAVSEFARLREAGASFMVFAWPAFWWLEYYTGLHRHLRENFPCVLENERLIAFDLRAEV